MTANTYYNFNQQFEQALGVIKETPWVVLRLKQLNQLYAFLSNSLGETQQLAFKPEVDALAQTLAAELATPHESVSGLVPRDLLTFYNIIKETGDPVTVQKLAFLIIEQWFRLGAFGKLTDFLRNCQWFSTEISLPPFDTGSDLNSLQRVLLRELTEYLPDDLLRRLKAVISGDHHESSSNQIKGLFVINAGEQHNGLLAELSLESLKLFKEPGTDQLRIATHLVDEDDILSAQTKHVFTWLRQKYPQKIRGHLRLEYTLSEKRSVLSGSSLGLALGILARMAFYGLDNNRRFEPRIYSDVAVTGALDASGHVLPVNQETLSAKLEAAFYSRVNTVVLPHQHRQAAESLLAELNSEYPLRRLNLVFVAHIDEIETHKDIFFYQRRRVSQRTKQFFSNHANFVTVASMLFILMLGAAFWLGIVKDPVPVKIVNRDQQLTVVNAHGFRLWKPPGYGAKLPDNLSQYARVFDLDADGNPEILAAYNQHTDTDVQGFLVCYDEKGDELWRYKAGYEVQTGVNTYPDSFGAKFLHIVDLDADGKSEIIFLADIGYFPVRLVVLDHAGKFISEYWHCGGPDEIIFEDVYPETPYREIILAGRNNEYKTGMLTVLDPYLMHGQSPQQTAYYKLKDIEPGNELYYLRFPQTHFAMTGTRDVTTRLFMAHNGLINVNIVNENVRSANVHYMLNQQMGIIFTDLYDMYYEEYKSHFPDQPPLIYNDPELIRYFQQVEYWDGKSWQKHSCMNQFAGK